MKYRTNTRDNLFRIFTAVLISMLLCFGMCACGDEGTAEETVEITTPSEETTTTATEKTTEETSEDEEDTSEDEDASDDEDKEDAKDSKDAKDSTDKDIASGSQYAKIYKDSNAEMKAATEKYVAELESKSKSLSKSKLYDETQDRIDKLKEIYDDTKKQMVDAMLASTEDDVKEYEKYFKKLSEQYTEYSRTITSVYTDAF